MLAVVVSRNFFYVLIALSIGGVGTGIAVTSDKPAYISIIIDDLGYNSDHAAALIRLPQALTFSVLPFSPKAQQLAALAREYNKEVMLHLPMESEQQPRNEPHTLQVSMDEALFKQTLRYNLWQLPEIDIAGVNNHMGSKLTACPLHMQWLMQELAKTQLYFIDSRTTTETVAAHSADAYQVPQLSRDVFLDNDKDSAHIAQQLQQLKQLALKRGYALAIGHPYAETYAVLQTLLPELEQSGIQLVPVSKLLALRKMPVAFSQKQ